MVCNPAPRLGDGALIAVAIGVGIALGAGMQNVGIGVALGCGIGGLLVLIRHIALR